MRASRPCIEIFPDLVKVNRKSFQACTEGGCSEGVCQAEGCDHFTTSNDFLALIICMSFLGILLLVIAALAAWKRDLIREKFRPRELK